MALPFEEEATREHVWLRAFNMGPTGSGKSKGALELASRLFGGDLGVTLVNSEQGRGKLYADRYKYGLIDLSADGVGADNVDFGPEVWIEALDLCEQRNPGGVYILDSCSHEWAGKNGILQRADRFGDWKTVRPQHATFVERIQACQAHVIVCCRAKMQYKVEEVQDGDRKKQSITMLGVGPVQADDFQYEFNLVGRFDQASKDVIWSGHVDPLVGTVSNFAEETHAQAVADTLSKWLSEGDPVQPPEAADEDAVTALLELWAELRPSDWEEVSADVMAKARRQNRGALHPDWVAEQAAKATTAVEEKRKAAKEKAAREKAEPAPAAG